MYLISGPDSVADIHPRVRSTRCHYQHQGKAALKEKLCSIFRKENVRKNDQRFRKGSDIFFNVNVTLA
jgi:hypothetical protein